MAGNDLVVNIGGTSASYDAAATAAQRATVRLEATLKTAAVAQEQLNKAVAQYGASSAEATAASKTYEAAQGRVARASETAAIASKRAAEQQVRDAKAVAVAAEAQAAKQAAALRKVGSIAGGIGAAAAVGLGLAAKAAADFDAKLAVLKSLSPEADIQALADAAHNYANIGVSASEAADAEIELTKAGIGVKDQLGGALTGALNLAAAGQLDVADATSIAAQAMTQFQLSGKDVPHLADLLAAGADRALGSVGDLGEGMKYAGLSAHQLGISVDDTVAVLSEFAQAGLIGSQGGTTLQQVLRQLTGPTDKAAAEIKALNLHLYDAHGNFVGLASVAQQLHDKLSPMSQASRDAALNTLFTSRAVRGATILYQDGAKGVEYWQKQVQASGFAAQQASGKMDSLQGDAEKLRAEFVNFAIDMGQQLQPALRTVTQDLTALIGFLGHIPGPLKEAAALTLAFTAAVGAGVFVYSRAKTGLQSLATTLGVVKTAEAEAGAAATVANGKMLALRGGAALAGFALLSVSSDVKKTHQSLGELTEAAGAAAVGFSVGGPVGAAIFGFGDALKSAIEDNGYHASKAMETLAESIEKVGQAASDPTNAIDGMGGLLATAGIGVDQYSRALEGNERAQGRVILKAHELGGIASQLIIKPIDLANDANERWVESMQRASDKAGLYNAKIHAMGSAVDDFGTVIPRASAEVDDFAEGNRRSADATAAAAHAARLAAQAATAYKNALISANNAILELRGGYRGYQAALDDAQAALKKNGETLDINTAKGRENQAALDAIASSAQDAEKHLHGAALVKFNDDARDHLIKMAEAFGMSDSAAKNYADRVLRDFVPATDKAKGKADDLSTSLHNIPKNVDPRVQLEGADSAITKAQSVKAAIERIPHSWTVHIGIAQEGGSLPLGINGANGMVLDQYANGGVRRESHVAQIAPAGAWRVWAEPETGGEAYIPLAPEKRPRSRAVASEAVSRLGGQVIWNANGAVYSGMGGGGAVTVNQIPYSGPVTLTVDGRSFSAFMRHEARGVVLAYADHATQQAKGGA